MMEILYILFIAPIEFIMNMGLEFLFSHTNSYGISIILLSIFINLLIIPLHYLSEKLSSRERFMQHVMQDDINQINTAFTGQERYMMLRTLYRQYEYHPIFALRTSLGLLIQIPFFIAAYKFLSVFSPLEGASFLFIQNLAKPDTAAHIGSLPINILPILMTCISMVTTYFYTKNSSKRDKIQGYGLALLFLVLLYVSPSGLVLYWTSNNIIYLFRNIFASAPNGIETQKYNSRTVKELYKSNEFLKKIVAKLDNMSLILPLGFLLSYIFMWSNNAHMFSFVSIGICFVIIVLVAVLLWGLGELWEKLSTYFLKKYTIFLRVLNAALFSGALSLTLGIFALAVVVTQFPIRPTLAILWAVLFCVFLLRLTKQLNMIMLLCIVISALRLLTSLQIVTQDTAQHDVAPLANAESVHLIHKPNIYLFWLESYNDLSLQKKVYNIDVEPLKQFLQVNNFTIYDDVYSDGHGTLAAFNDLFSMGLIRAKNYGNADASFGVRSLLAGDDNNLVLKILKDNGYLTQMTYSRHFLYMTGGQKLQNLDVVNYKTNKIAALQPLYAFIAGSIQTKMFISSVESLSQEVDTYIKNGKQSGKPFFISFKGGALHTGPGHDYKNMDRWLTRDYPSYVNRANKELKEIVSNIIEQDPHAMIILIGDHGPWRFHGLWKGKSVTALRNAAKKENIEYNDVVDDYFNVHLSIRFPRGEKYDLQQGYYMSHVNLFSHIFSYLSKNKDLLKKRVTSRSIFYGIPITEDGKILEK